MTITVQFPTISTSETSINSNFTFDTKIYKKPLAISFLLPIKLDIEVNQTGQPFSYNIKEIRNSDLLKEENDIAKPNIHIKQPIGKHKLCKYISDICEHDSKKEKKYSMTESQIEANKIKNEKFSEKDITVKNEQMDQPSEDSSSLPNRSTDQCNISYMYILKFTKANLRLFQDNPIIKVKASELCTAKEILQQLEQTE